MAAVDEGVLDAMAELARLAVPSGQRQALIEELSAVLGLFDQLARAPVDGLKPLLHPGDPLLRLRADEVREGDRREDFEAIAPSMNAGYYLVPKVIE